MPCDRTGRSDRFRNVRLLFWSQRDVETTFPLNANENLYYDYIERILNTDGTQAISKRAVHRGSRRQGPHQRGLQMKKKNSNY